MKYTKILKRATAYACISLLSITSASCGGTHSSENLLNETMEEINKSGNGADDFKVFNNPEYFAIVYKLENTPENKAKILWLGQHQELGDKFRTKMLNNLEKGDILSQVVKEDKALVLAVQADEIEYHAVYTPEEINSRVLKK